METIGEVPVTEPRHIHTTREAAVGGSAVEALAGAAAVVLSIIALSGRGVLPLAAVAVIATGVALLFEAGAVAASERGALGAEPERAAVKGGIGADAIAGIGAVALGILTLIGIDPMILLPVSAIVLGAGLLLSAAAPAAERETTFGGGRALTHDALAASSGVHVLVGAGAVVLGILGVLGKAPVELTLISMLSIGAGQLLTGATLGGRMFHAFRHGT